MAGADVQELHCKTLLNKVDYPRFPFKWTMNPYRGCRHACTYCYARPTHEFWGMDSGNDFETRIFAKVNAPEVLRKELKRPSWRSETIAIGTASGLLMAKLMSLLSGRRVNPMIGAAGVSAVPMAARVVQKLGQKEDINEGNIS